MPLPVIIILLLFGLLLYSLSKRKKTAITLITTATLALTLFSLKPVSEPLIRSIEWQNKPLLDLKSNNLDYIIVLGCNHTNTLSLPATMQLHSCSLSRVVEAVRLFNEQKHQIPKPTIIFTGYGGFNIESNARVAARAAISLGIPKSNTLVFSEPKDTREEALVIADTIRGYEAALVTSASHMPRALAYFHAQDLDPFPAPASYYAKSSRTEVNYQTLSPQADSLEIVKRSWYELLSTLNQKVLKP